MVNLKNFKLVHKWNETHKAYSRNKTIQKIFETQVKKTPNNIAVVYGDIKLTYQELNQKANQLAHYLRRTYQVQGDDLIALYLDRSENMLIAILAILKSGAAYVAIDPNYPEERICYILEDTRAKVIFGNKIYQNKLNRVIKSLLETDNVTTLNVRASRDHVTCSICLIDDIKFKAILKKELITNLHPKITSQNLAYIIYTSGTTGMPKGVMISHRSLVNGILNVINTHNINAGCRILSRTIYAYDPFLREIFSALLVGAELHLSNSELNYNIDDMLAYIQANSINFMIFVPSYFITIVSSKIFHQNKNCLAHKTIFLCGEDFSSKKIMHLVNTYNMTISHQYGVSELSQVLFETIYKPMCKPIMHRSMNNYFFILDSNMNHVPTGATGELYIGGDSLARGYLNQEKLTKEKFIKNSFVGLKDKKQKLYRTGDLVRYLSDGRVEYVARNDFQVKINGFRIELGEIEKILNDFTGIEQAVVITKFSAKKHKPYKQYLVGYYVSEHKLDEKAIQVYLTNKLPLHMVPQIFIWLTKLPLSANGKLDRVTLAKIECAEINYVEPRNKLESEVCHIFANIFELPKGSIGINADFFSLGGNSILAIKLVSDLNRLFCSSVRVRDIFEYKTVQEIANIVATTIGTFVYEKYIINEIDLPHLYLPFELNNVQQAYYLGRSSEFELGNVATHSYSELIFNELNLLRLEKALNKLICRHLGLRTIFINGQQQYLENVPYYKVAYHEIYEENKFLNIRAELSHKIYALDKFPLFDFMVSKLDQHYILHFSCDDLLLDWNSSQILFQELTSLYDRLNIKLLPLNVTGRDYALKLKQINNSHLFTRAKKYWSSKLDQYDFTLSLPLLCSPSEIKFPVFDRISRVISKDIWYKIENKVSNYKLGLTSFLLYIYGRVLGYWANKSKLNISLTLFNRIPLHPHINNIIGNFTGLELFNYQDITNKPILQCLQCLHQQLWSDIEYNLFDGIDFQRLIRRELDLPNNQIIAPLVLTSMLGNGTKYGNRIINDSYQGINYAISQTSQVWLDNKAYETKDGFVAEWDYVKQLFDPGVIEAMHTYYCDLIRYFADANWEIDFPPHRIPPISTEKVIKAANMAKQPVLRETLFGYYEDQVKKNGLLEHIAVVDYVGRMERYSYADILKDSDLLAKYLYSCGKTKHRLIAILSEKSYNHVVSTIAIMKSGFGYLPLNIDWPIDRLKNILEQGGVRTLLISKFQANRAELIQQLTNTYKLLIIENILEEINCENKLRNKLIKVLLPKIKVDDVAYVIFTSGSTGTPKGVTISHRGALNTILAVNTKYKITHQDRILALSELSFDLSVYDIFGMLTVGGTIIFPDQRKIKDPGYWAELIHLHKITVWNTVPQLAKLLIEHINTINNRDNVSEFQPCILNTLRLFLLSGDFIPLCLPREIVTICQKTKVISLGGATEGSIWSIWYDVTSINYTWLKIPYGVAMPNQKMYILNNELEHTPIGVVGEIYIGGVGVAINYWEDKNKTTASFIPHPKLGRIYKTGDLGCWNKDGYMEFIGRRDNQVKLNGYRVELQEIEVRLNKLVGISNSLVVLFTHNAKNYIVAYLVPDEANLRHLTVAEINTFKLTCCGIDKKLNISKRLLLSCNEEDFKRRKSYRNFISNRVIETKLLDQEIDQLESKLLKFEFDQTIGSTAITSKIILRLLSKLACINLVDRVLPKYLYPSAGSCYPVRVYLNIRKSIANIDVGYYYYNPLAQSLCITQDKIQKVDITDYLINLDFVVYWPAIMKLYTHDAKRFAYLEIGHILGLLFDDLILDNVAHRIELYEETIDTENSLFARVVFLKSQAKSEKLDVVKKAIVKHINCIQKINIFTKNQNKNFESTTNVKLVDLEAENIFMRSNAHSGLLLERGSLLLTIDGDDDKENLICCGMMFQMLANNLYYYNIGSCMLGYKISANNLYAMVLGSIAESDKVAVECNAPEITISEFINQELAKVLPDYMLPYENMIINKFPLTSNGKLDRKSLPTPTFMNAVQLHVLPRNQIEEDICGIFAKILEIEVEDIGITDDFFKLGGNSLLAIQVIDCINIKFHTKIRLVEIYRLKTVENIVRLECFTNNSLSEVETL